MATDPQTVDRPSSDFARRLLAGAGGPLLVLLLVIGFFAAADYWKNGSTRFLGARNARNIVVQTSTVAVAALGMTIVIIAGGIDLSAGTALSLSATVMAWLLREGYGIGPALMAGIGAGMAAGLVNGLLISSLRIVPFIVTLGTMSVYLGLAKLVAEETTVRPALEQVPAWIPALVEPVPEPEWLLVSSGVWIALALALLLAIVLRYTVFGRYVFALGSNESTARLCGVNVPLMKTAVYTLAGLFVGIAGIYQFARLSSGDPTSGIGQELKVIAAVVIGGASLNGGKGTVLGTLAGAAMMGVIASGCNTVLGVSNPMQNILIGIIIVAAAALDQIRERRLAS